MGHSDTGEVDHTATGGAGERAARRPVQRLPPQLANQIAAGEVVTRPASVVKELLENSMDADARSITVSIDGGGIEAMVVRDDGCGMTEPDARLALERHATSKLTDIDDLRRLGTFGFRGEALPSIASVSKLTLTTRTRDGDGIELSVAGGGEPRVAPAGTAPGTTVAVRELFFNVPARRKFLRAVTTESAHVTDVVRAAALAHPGVQFELIRDGRRSRRWLRAESSAARVHDVLRDYALVSTSGSRGPVSIEAHLSRPDRARSGAGGLSIFVAGRPVQDRAIARAVARAYGDALDGGRYPVGAIFIELPLDLVDVNVHPQKSEVRFAHARAVTDAVFAVVREGLDETLGRPKSALAARPLRAPERDPAPWSWDGGAAQAPREPPPAPEQAAAARGPILVPREPSTTRATAAAPTLAQAAAKPARAPASDDGAEEEPAPSRPLVGVARDEHLVVDGRDAILVIPRVAAARARLERLVAVERQRGALVSQRLLFPEVAQVEAKVADSAAQQAAALTALGFEVRRLGPTTLALHALPRALAHTPLAELQARLFALLPRLDRDGDRLVDELIEAAAPIDARRADVAALLAGLDDATLTEIASARISYRELS